MVEQKKRGRPRKYADSAERVKAFRRRQKKQGWRYDIYLGDQAGARLYMFAKSWDCPVSQVIERLLLEADDRYEDVLFPVTE